MKRAFPTGILKAILIVFAVCAFAAQPFAQDLPVVTALEVKGLKRIEEGAVRSKLSQKIGEALSQQKTTDDIKAIYKMGYFDDVRTELVPFEGGIKVVYQVKEKPTVIKVDFQGNKEYDDKTLREKIALSPGAISDITLINDNAIKLRAWYEEEGYYLSKVVPVVRKISEDDVTVTYQIEEGDKVTIRQIRFEGNKALSSGKLKDVMKTGERHFYSFITGSGYYKKEEMRRDVVRVRDRYFDSGYIKAQIGEPKIELAADKRGMVITIPVQEGERFSVSAIEITGNKTYSEKELRPLVKLMPKKVFSRELMRKDIDAISGKYTNTGYAIAAVIPDLIPDDAAKTVKVVYRIEEGDKYKVGRIEIAGNTKTKDKVIRREVRLNEGDTFNASALKRSYERLNNLNYFENVEINPKPRSEEKVVDLDVKVKEKDTGMLTLGGGYSSNDGIIGLVDVTQANLFGGGQYLKLKGELGGQMRNLELTYRDPWFLDEDLKFGASLYRSYRQYGNFDRKSNGMELTIGREFWEYWGWSVSYGLEDARIYNVRTDASQRVKDQEGKWLTSAISPSVWRDSRDNYIFPLSGSRNALSLSFAGLGGNTGYIKAIADSSWYFPLFDVTTIHVRGRIGSLTGILDKKVPIYQKFYVGGLDTVRGLEYGHAGPLDINREAIGGEKMAVLNLEYIFPIFQEVKLKGLVFTDMGRAWDKGETIGSDLRYTAGLGMRWFSPFGPIRVEYGFNLKKKEGESGGKFEFGFGSAF